MNILVKNNVIIKLKKRRNSYGQEKYENYYHQLYIIREI